MAVSAKRIVRGVGRLEYATQAKDIRSEGHPLHPFYLNWLRQRGTEDTKRQARKFLAVFPMYREIVG